MKAFAALPLLALAGCSVCQPTRFTWPVFVDSAPLAAFRETGGESGGTSVTPVSEPVAAVPEPSAVAPDTPTSSAPPEASSPPSTPTTETPSEPSAPSAPSTSYGVGGQQETREESHDRG